MHDAVGVQVPGQFAEELVNAGFQKVRRLRGAGLEPVLTFVATSAGLAADAATILVARDAVSDFISRLRSWMVRHAGSATGSEFVIEVSARSPGARSHMRIVAQRTTEGAVPQVDMKALESLLRYVLVAEPDETGSPAS